MADRDLAVLIVARRGADLLDRALRAVATWLPGAAVRVWDQGSSPAIADLVARYPGVERCSRGTDIGYPAAMNRLVAAGREPELLLLDPAVELRGPLPRARAALADPAVVAVAPTVRGPGPGDEPWDVARRTPTVLRALVAEAGLDTRFRGRRGSDRYRYAPDVVDGHLAADCLLTTRAVWEELGELDEWFPDPAAHVPWQRTARARGRTLRLVAEDAPPVRAEGADRDRGSDAAGRADRDRDVDGRREDVRRASGVLVLGTAGNRGPGRVFSAGALILDRALPARRADRRRRRAHEARRAPGMPSVVIVTNGVALGGAERQRVLLADELVARGHPVTLVCLQHLGILLGELDPRVRVVFQPWWQPVVDVPTADAVLVGGGTRTEIGFALGWRAQGRRARVQGRRWLPALHNAAAPDRPSFSGLRAWALPRADALLVLSETHRRDLTRHQRLHDDVLIAPNGLPAVVSAPFAPARAGPLRFGMLTRIHAFKNPLLLVEALDALGPHRRADWTLDIFGEGPDLTRFREETPAHLRDRVCWRGPVPGPDEALAEVDVLCLPSRSEAFPMAILEAMARGVAVMASAVGSVPEMLDHGRAGILVEPVTRPAWSAALDAALADRGRLGDLAAAGRRRATEHYSVTAMADAYQRAFARVLAGSGGTSPRT